MSILFFSINRNPTFILLPGETCKLFQDFFNKLLTEAASVNRIQNMREVILYPGEDGCWVTECPSLPGCISQGTTREEAIQNIKEAIEGYVLALEDDGLPVPAERFDAMVVAV